MKGEPDRFGGCLEGPWLDLQSQLRLLASIFRDLVLWGSGGAGAAG
jgi:hypothetical protein